VAEFAGDGSVVSIFDAGADPEATGLYRVVAVPRACDQILT
jgi:hypothetical protein